MNKNLTALLNECDTLKSKLNSLRPLTADELARLRKEFIIETAYNSNAIEGNTLTLRETALILNDGVTIAEKPIRDHLDVIGYKDAFYFLFSVVADNEPLSERIIKDLHALVLMSNAEHRGQYRKIPVKILGADNEPTAPHFIKEEMARLIETYHTRGQEHPILSVAWLHLAFESIHPFIDGNGRTGRLLLNFELMKNGFLPVDIKFTDRMKYYQCFDEYHRTGTAHALAELIANYERAELARYVAILE